MAVKKRKIRETTRIYLDKREELDLGIAWYKPGQWELLKKVSQDGNLLENTYKEWLEFIEKKLIKLEKRGVAYKKITVDVKELLKWCKSRGYPINSESRSLYVSEKLMKGEKKSKKKGN
jgi:hypothetical protein